MVDIASHLKPGERGRRALRLTWRRPPNRNENEQRPYPSHWKQHPQSGLQATVQHIPVSGQSHGSQRLLTSAASTQNECDGFAHFAFILRDVFVSSCLLRCAVSVILLVQKSSLLAKNFMLRPAQVVLSEKIAWRGLRLFSTRLDYG